MNKFKGNCESRPALGGTVTFQLEPELKGGKNRCKPLFYNTFALEIDFSGLVRPEKTTSFQNAKTLTAITTRKAGPGCLRVERGKGFWRWALKKLGVKEVKR